MSTKELKKTIITGLADILKPLGYKRAGNIFSKTTDDLVYSIGLQSSFSSTADILKFTLNINIISKKLYELSDTVMPLNAQEHYRRRIGYYIQPGGDKWWVVNNHYTTGLAVREIKTIIVEKVIPDFEQLKSISDIYCLWKQGKGTGITAGAMKYFMQLLEQAGL